MNSQEYARHICLLSSLNTRDCFLSVFVLLRENDKKIILREFMYKIRRRDENRDQFRKDFRARKKLISINELCK